MKAKFFTGSLLIVSLFFIFGFTMCREKEQTLSPNTDILGMWVLEDDPATKVEFLTNGTVKNYTGNVHESTDQYAITNVAPDGATSSDLYLKITFPEGDSFYYLINGINANNSNLLSLMTMNQGKVIVYKRP